MGGVPTVEADRRPDVTPPADGSSAPVQVPRGSRPQARRGLGGRIADRLVADIVIGSGELICRMPESPLWLLGNVAGTIEYWVTRSRRDQARMNLRRVCEWMAAHGVGDERYHRAATDARALEAIVRSSFRHHAHYYVELARAPRFDYEYLTRHMVIDNPAEVDAALAERKALLLVGLHFGTIELPGFLALNRIGQVVAPMESLRNERIQAYMKRTRGVIGVRILTIEEAGPELLAVLRRNEPIGIIADRDLTGSGLPVELFGGRTKIPAGPALLSTETGAPIYVSGVRRMGPGRYRGILYPLPAPTGNSRKERSRSMARDEAVLFEKIVAAAPEQWLAIFHPIWPDLVRGRKSTGVAG
jgi:phosphatidylinositol dimannoside acyltransferase